jgi:murein DD-endopeptidase MepM/ murein hydrolase activator NlpD
MQKNSPKSGFKSLQKKLLTKYRLVIMNDTTFEEKLSFRLSRMNVFILISSSGFLLIFLTVLIIAFSPLREYIPGYSNIEDRNKLYKLSVKADSIQQIVSSSSVYIDSLLMVLTGTDEFGKPDYGKINMLVTGSADEGKNKGKTLQRTNIYESLFYYKPTDGVVVQGFNPAMNHLGIDIVTPAGSPVMSVRDGTVILARWNHEFGNILVIQHPGNIVSVYKHNSLLLKSEGELVRGGQVVAISGNTGEISTGPHLHFELWINGAPVNPALFLQY